ncbi:histone deacetylase 4 isoform X2 [Nematostella vectensis]|nr:histone deacetylase 4 isoform X2 [Nematostella vectensis]
MDGHLNYPPPQEGNNVPQLILTPAQQQQLASLLQLKQQQQHILHQQSIQQHLLYQHYQQQQYLQQQQELNYNPHLRQYANKQKGRDKAPMEQDHPVHISKPKIKIEPEDEPKDNTEDLMDQDGESSKEPPVKQEQPPKPLVQTVPPPQASPPKLNNQEMTSSAVKKKLQTFVLNKQQREMAVASITDQAYKHWNADRESDHLGPLSSHLDTSHFPLRKTASEPNLKVKSRIKAKVAEHRTIGSPLLHRRRERNGNKLHRSMTLETCTNESAECSSPNSPTQSISASPHRESSSPLGAPGSLLGHSLPNLQQIPRLAANIDRTHVNQLLLSNQLHNHHPVYIHRGLSKDISRTDFYPQYINDALYDGMEEEEDATLSAVALRQAQLKNITLAQSQAQLLGSSGSQLLKANSLAGRSAFPVLSSNGSPPQNAPLPVQKSTLSPNGTQSGQGGNNLRGHRPLRQTVSAPGYTLSDNPQIQQQQVLKQNQELLHQQQHLQFLQQQRQSRYLQQLQLEQIMQQSGKAGLQKALQQKETSALLLKEHMEQVQQKEQERYHLLQTEQQLVQVGTTEDLPSPRFLKEQQLQELLLIQQLKQQDLQPRNITQKQLLQHQQLLQLRQADVHGASAAGSTSSGASIGHRPLTRASSLPAVASDPASPGVSRTGLVYDNLMLKHQCSCGDATSHPEHPGRLQSIWARLQETGVVNMCDRVRPRKATLAEILSVHSEQHTMLFGGSTQCRTKAEDGTITTLKCFSSLPCGGMGVDGDTIWNEVHSANAARMAVGCVVELTQKVAAQEIKNGMAIVRPPGHHAEAHQAMGFCYFNNVAIAARLLRLKMSIDRVLIIDWDIHHGNGTQQMFYDDPHVLYISLHRHDDGTFFPGTGKAEECGAGIGVGYNVNIAWSGGLDPPYGDAEYLAAFRSVVIPIAKEFQPDIILVSCGFDAAAGHSPQLGGYKVSAPCFAHLTNQLMDLADGRVVLALEGGYSLPSLCDAAEACLRALLSDTLPEIPKESLKRAPNPNAIAVLEKTIAIQSRYWSSVKRSINHISHSVVEAQQREKEEAETVSALASLSMGVVQDSKVADVQMEDDS